MKCSRFITQHQMEVNMADLVQLQNPKTKRWTLIDRDLGKILDYSDKKFKDVDTVKQRLKKDKEIKPVITGPAKV